MPPIYIIIKKEQRSSYGEAKETPMLGNGFFISEDAALKIAQQLSSCSQWCSFYVIEIKQSGHDED